MTHHITPPHHTTSVLIDIILTTWDWECHEGRLSDMTANKWFVSYLVFFGACTYDACKKFGPSPPCPLIYTIKFTQPPLLCMLLGDPSVWTSYVHAHTPFQWCRVQINVTTSLWLDWHLYMHPGIHMFSKRSYTYVCSFSQYTLAYTHWNEFKILGEWNGSRSNIINFIESCAKKFAVLHIKFLSARLESIGILGWFVTDSILFFCGLETVTKIHEHFIAARQDAPQTGRYILRCNGQTGTTTARKIVFFGLFFLSWGERRKHVEFERRLGCGQRRTSRKISSITNVLLQ